MRRCARPSDGSSRWTPGRGCPLAVRFELDGDCIALDVGVAWQKGAGVLESADLVAFVPTTDLERAAAFYGDLLGLTVVESSPYAVVVQSGRTTLRVTLVDQLTPHPFTVLGWEVENIAETLRALAAKGVPAERFAGMDQDELGVWTAPGGGLIAWFKDPDDNVLSVSQLS